MRGVRHPRCVAMPLTPRPRVPPMRARAAVRSVMKAAARRGAPAAMEASGRARRVTSTAPTGHALAVYVARPSESAAAHKKRRRRGQTTGACQFGARQIGAFAAPRPAPALPRGPRGAPMRRIGAFGRDIGRDEGPKMGASSTQKLHYIQKSARATATIVKEQGPGRRVVYSRVGTGIYIMPDRLVGVLDLFQTDGDNPSFRRRAVRPKVNGHWGLQQDHQTQSRAPSTARQCGNARAEVTILQPSNLRLLCNALLLLSVHGLE